MKKGGKRQGSGRKKQAPTTTQNFRIETELKAKLKAKFGKKLNAMFKEWATNIVNSDSV
jgi:hypothetical protein